jgi:hypothetical protein
MCSGRVNSSCSTSRTLRVNQLTHPVTSHERRKDRKVYDKWNISVAICDTNIPYRPCIHEHFPHYNLIKYNYIKKGTLCISLVPGWHGFSLIIAGYFQLKPSPSVSKIVVVSYNVKIFERGIADRGSRGHGRMVVGFTTTYAVSVYQHWCCNVESQSERGVQHYVIKLVSDLRQVGGFRRLLRLTATI